MTNFETTSSVNPRAGNGSANVYDVLNQLQQQGATPYSTFPQQQQPFYQTPFAQQRFQQQPYFQQPYFQQFGGQPYQFQQPFQQFQQPFAQGASPWATQWQQNPYLQSGFGMQQGIAPAITHRSAELKLKIPVQKLIGRHPQEIQQYLLQVVLPVLLDGITKRAMNPELGLTVTTDLRGETVVEIDI